MTKTVIIGTSAAGIATASKLRDLDPQASIVCISKEEKLPYNRCLLADFLHGTKTEQEITTKHEAFFVDKNITLKLGAEVIALNPTTNKIMLSNGTEINYDNLVIATGKSAFIPPPLAPQIPGVIPFYDLDHAEKIRAYIAINSVKKILVVGAGITGLECIDALLGKDLSLSCVEKNKSVLAHQIDSNGAQFLQSIMTQQGISLYLDAFITVIEKKESKINITLNTGKQLEVDLVIAATGGRQNINFAQAAGITCDEFGIITNEFQATNIPNIFAAGDACSIINLTTGTRISNSLWPDAVAQGLTAAHSIAGLTKPYAGSLNITSTNIFGTTVVTCGNFTTCSNLDTLGKQEADFYHKFYLKDGILRGFVMIGNVGGVGQLRKAIVEKTRIG